METICPHCQSNRISLISENHEEIIHICTNFHCRYYEEIVDQTLIVKLSDSFQIFLNKELYLKNIYDIFQGNTSFILLSKIHPMLYPVRHNIEHNLLKMA